jgi:misacylated tRNA(Ala) deacylase
MSSQDVSVSADSESDLATDLLYQRDPYRSEFEAVILDVDSTEGVAIDRSAFYPGGGGQPCDTGTITRHSDGATWNVSQVRKIGSSVRLSIEPSERQLESQDVVLGVLDWKRRYRLMRTHTALHVLCGVVFLDYGALVTGGNMGPEKARMDFELEEFSADLVGDIERRANEEIAKGREVKVSFLPREQAFAIPDLIRTKINLLPAGIEEIRIVEIEGLDLQADGGTHIANTKEVGGIRVIGTRSKGKINKRLEIALVGGDGDEENLRTLGLEP